MSLASCPSCCPGSRPWGTPAWASLLSPARQLTDTRLSPAPLPAPQILSPLRLPATRTPIHGSAASSPVPKPQHGTPQARRPLPSSAPEWGPPESLLHPPAPSWGPSTLPAACLTSTQPSSPKSWAVAPESTARLWTQGTGAAAQRLSTLAGTQSQPGPWVTPLTTTMWALTRVQGLPLARHGSHGATWISSPSRTAVVLRGSPLPAKWSPDFFWHRRPP